MATIPTSSSNIQFQSAKSQLVATKMNHAAGEITAAKADQKMDKAIAAAKDFEAVFISEMMKPMFETISVDDTFGGGKGEEIFRGFMVQEYGKIFAERGGLGIASQVQAELLRHQSHQNSTTQQGAAL